jgi:hypothetical protein
MLYMSTSFMQAEILAWRLGDGRTAPEIAWRSKKQAPQMPSPLLVDDELYFVNDRGVATCLDAKYSDASALRQLNQLGGTFAGLSSLTYENFITFLNSCAEIIVAAKPAGSTMTASDVTFQIYDAAEREMRGEVNFLVKEEFFAVKGDEVEIEDFVKSLDKDAVIEAAVAEFRAKFAELLDECIESYED